MHQLLIDVWSNIYNCHKDLDDNLDAAAFCNKYRSAIDSLKQACELPPLEGHKLFRKTRRKKSCTAGGLDGWSMKEIQLLPPIIWDLFVFVPMLAVAGHDWPAVFKLVPVSQLDKGAGSEDPLATRGVGCCAFLYTIWASIRYADSIQWQFSIVPADSFGGLPGRCCADAELWFSVDLHESLREKCDIVGAAVDRSKSFDRLRPRFAARVMQELGMDVRLLRAADSFYHGHAKIFKLGRSYSGQVSCANSAIQGCSLSVLITNIMYAIGHVVVHAAAPAASLSSYIDDCKVWVTATHSAQLISLCNCYS
ncbi:unnamed protein product [Polarella glacialis]|uniref:Reverse transcriptase domain-containing protein n=1 Tax=Polarella glacialis TaxID=89957 RepID=A0A813DGC0_POLGL|nr:unnamed protein product [Polarella glacialis]